MTLSDPPVPYLLCYFVLIDPYLLLKMIAFSQHIHVIRGIVVSARCTISVITFPHLDVTST